MSAVPARLVTLYQLNGIHLIAYCGSMVLIIALLVQNMLSLTVLLLLCLCDM